MLEFLHFMVTVRANRLTRLKREAGDFVHEQSGAAPATVGKSQAPAIATVHASVRCGMGRRRSRDGCIALASPETGHEDD